MQQTVRPLTQFASSTMILTGDLMNLTKKEEVSTDKSPLMARYSQNFSRELKTQGKPITKKSTDKKTNSKETIPPPLKLRRRYSIDKL